MRHRFNPARLKEIRRSYAPVWLVTAFGLLLRSYHYLRNPALWHDEAAVVLNVLRKNFSDLLGLLYVSATGPPLSLWLQKCCVLCLGDSTYALRFLSFVASCAGLIVMAVLAVRLLRPLAATAAVLLIACSDRLLWHAAEARHYSGDAAIAAGLTLLFLVTRNRTTTRRTLCFALVAPFAILSSYPAVFLFAGLTIALASTFVRDHQSRLAWFALFALIASIAASFLFLFFTAASAQRTSALEAAWAGAFPDWHHPVEIPMWLVLSSIGVVDYAARPIGGILIIVVSLGAMRWWHGTKRDLVLLLLTPFGLAALAGLAGVYPYKGARTMAFALPAIALLIGGGIEAIEDALNGSVVRRWLATIVVGVPILAVLALSLYRVWVPWPRADTAGASAYVLEHRAEAEPVTANHWEYEYYFRKLDGGFYPDLRLLQQTPLPRRYWVVLTSSDPAFAWAVAQGLPRGRVVERHEFCRTTVLLVETRTS